MSSDHAAPQTLRASVRDSLEAGVNSPEGAVNCYAVAMENTEHDDEEILGAVASSGARVLIIGRKALIILGLPVMTNDYDFWVHIDDIEKLNAAFFPLDHVPNKTPDAARKTGRYVLENGEHIDVMVARAASTRDGTRLDFDEAWGRRQVLEAGAGITVALPSIADLIITKMWSARAKDIGDIQLLETLRRGDIE